MTPKIAALFEQHGAQDTGGFAIVFEGGKHSKVAQWNDPNDQWDLLPAGAALLDAAVADVVAEAAATKGKNKPKPASDELDLD